MSTDRDKDSEAPAVTVRARPYRISDVADSLATGWQTFRALPAVSIAYAGVFALIGTALLGLVGYFGVSPMALPISGGFLLVGPALLAGFFRLAAIAAYGGRPGFRDAFAAFARTPAGVWLVAAICSFLFLGLRRR